MRNKIILSVIILCGYLTVFSQNRENKRITYIVNGDTISKKEFFQIDSTLIESISVTHEKVPDIPWIYSIATIYGTIIVKTKPVKSIKGIVQLADGYQNNTPAYGTLIRNKTTGKWVLTDESGAYEIPATNKDSIEYLFKGHHPQTIKTKRPVHNIVLQRNSFYKSYPRGNIIIRIDKEAYVDTEQRKGNISGIFLGLKPEDIEKIEVYKMTPTNYWGDGTHYPSIISITTKREKITYEATVPDAGFTTFLCSQPSKEFYSENMLKEKNRQSVINWNTRCKNPLVYDSTIYESAIDYDPQTNYGIDIEYILYMFFRFMEQKHYIKI